MAVDTNTQDTYETIGRREDLTDMIHNISPTETPFLSGCRKTKATNTYHEWQTDALDAAAQNIAVEGDNPTAQELDPTVRLGNYTQISTKAVTVSGSTEAADSAGRKSEMAYQLAKRAKEIKRDMEHDLLDNNARAVGDATTARESAGVPSWLATNTNLATDGSDPTGDGTDARSDGTQRAFTEAQLKDVLQSIWVAGGDPGVIMVGAFNKQALTNFAKIVPDVASNLQVYRQSENAADKVLTAAIDVYVSDFGTLKCVPNRFMRARDALVLDMEYWKVAYYRPFRSWELARTGDAQKRQLLVEYCLEACNEGASGIVADLSTS